MEKEDLIKKVEWLIGIRYVAVIITLLLGMADVMAVRTIVALISTSSLAGGILIYNTAGQLFLKKWRDILHPDKIIVLCFASLLADILVITILVRVTGGILSPFVLMYFYPIMVINLIAPDRNRYAQLIALVTIILYEGLISLESYNILPTLSSVPGISAIYKDPGILVYFLTIFPAFVIVAGFLSATLTGFLIATRKKLESKIIELKATQEKLISAMEELEKKHVEIAVLYELTSKIALSEDTNLTLNLILERLTQLTYSEVGLIYYLEAGNFARIIAQQGLPLDIIPKEAISLPDWASNLNEVASSEQLIYPALNTLPVKNCLFFPLQIKGKMRGILQLCRTTDQKFKIEEVRLISALLERIGLIIEYEEVILEKEKTQKALQGKVKELEEFNKLTVGREIKMIELEKKVNSLLLELGREPDYF